LTEFYLAKPRFTFGVISAADHFLYLFGLALFFFVSGFVLYYNYGSIETKDMVTFFKNRLIRIYPLYWLSIIAVLLLQAFHIEMFDIFWASPGDLLIQIIGLQGILAPRFVDRPPTLWFVGVILIFYLLFPLMIYLSNKGVNIIAASFFILLPLIALRIAFGMVDFFFFLFYAIFVAGIVASRYDAMHRYTPQLRFLCLGAVLFALLNIIGIRIAPQLFYATNLGLLFNVNPFTYFPADTLLSVTFALLFIILLNLLMLLFVYVAFTAAQLSAHKIGKMTLNLLLAIAVAAYSLYLFNIQVFACGYAILNDTFHLTGIHLDIAMVVLVVPILFAFSFLIQRKENEVIKRIRSTRAT
jgi:peptidoglycan/LPS O-acetylase OafA/YrhL